MKIRQGFVTNSSSSSFIIAFKDISAMFDCNKDGREYLKNINKILEDRLSIAQDNVWYSSYDGTIVSNKQELIDFFMDRYIYKDETLESYFQECPSRKENFDEYLNYLNNGYKILFREVDYSDDYFHSIISTLRNNENFVIIEED